MINIKEAMATTRKCAILKLAEQAVEEIAQKLFEYQEDGHQFKKAYLLNVSACNVERERIVSFAIEDNEYVILWKEADSYYDAEYKDFIFDYTNEIFYMLNEQGIRMHRKDVDGILKDEIISQWEGKIIL